MGMFELGRVMSNPIAVNRSGMPLTPQQQADITLFEQHLKHSKNTLDRTRLRYLALLCLIVSGSTWTSYRTYVNLHQQQQHAGLLGFVVFFGPAVLSNGLLAFFLLGGVYRDKIQCASLYVPRQNKTLTLFQLQYDESK